MSAVLVLTGDFGNFQKFVLLNNINVRVKSGLINKDRCDEITASIILRDEFYCDLIVVF